MFKKPFIIIVFVLFFVNSLLFPSLVNPVQADNLLANNLRLAGATRYQTAIDISQTGWTTAPSVVLARGDDFPDALAGAVFAHSSTVNGPLLLTDPQQLLPEVLTEIKRLQAQTVYILGGTGAVSQGVQDTLTQNGLTVKRLEGHDRYETAAAIALSAVPTANQAFLASGNTFADALSISSYAAANGIPLLLTQAGSVPDATLQALQKLGVQSVTLIGGEGVITPVIQSRLENLHYSVNRLAGADRYLTNSTILNTLNFAAGSVYVATGIDFPDALAGAVLAAQGKHPILLVPAANLNSATLAYINARRTAGTNFTLLGGWGVINYGIESIIRTGSVHPRISLQFLQGYGSGTLNTFLNQMNMIPGKATDYADMVAPNLFDLNLIPDGQTAADGSFSGLWDLSSSNYPQLVNAAHGHGLKILPMIGSEWSSAGKAAVDSALTRDTSRTTLVNNLTNMVQTTGADGVVIDFEYMSDSTGPYLTKFMQALYSNLHARNKIVVAAVPARTSAADWYTEFNYQDLSRSVDYLDIMTYDFSKSSPGPIAPLAWMKKVMDFAQSQSVPMSKVLLGIPYYGRDWSKNGDSYTNKSLGLTGALTTASTYHATIQRDTSGGDSAGIPYFTYTDSANIQHTVYYDDAASWEAKLSLLDTYGLGGIGSWSLYWVTSDSAPTLYPLLKEHLRLP